VVLPVPARPVKNTWLLVLFTNFDAVMAALSIHWGIPIPLEPRQL